MMGFDSTGAMMVYEIAGIILAALLTEGLLQLSLSLQRKKLREVRQVQD